MNERALLDTSTVIALFREECAFTVPSGTAESQVASNRPEATRRTPRRLLLAVGGAALGAGGLGEPIINGLSEQNTALVLTGAVLSGLLALSLDAALSLLLGTERSS